MLGTGINPGFLMDALPLFLTGICQRVDRIAVTRVIDASTRRGPFQAKIGSGLTVEAFQARMAAGRMGHVGLPESVGMVFDTLGKKLVRYESAVEPVVADRLVETKHFTVQPGQVMGLKQVARGYSAEGEFMTLTFIAALETGEEGDTVQIFGKPDLEVKLKGTNGDITTIAIVVNAVRRVLRGAARPGDHARPAAGDLYNPITNRLPRFSHEAAERPNSELYLHDHRQDHRPPLGPAVQELGQAVLDLAAGRRPGAAML